MSDNRSNDPTTVFYSKLAKGLNTAKRGNMDVRKGGALSCIALLSLLQSVREDKSEFDLLCVNIAGVHAHAKENAEVFNNAWAFWKDRFGMLPDKEQPDLTQLTAEDEEDLSDRRSENDAVRASVRTLRFACSVAYAMIANNINWAEQHLRFWPDKLALDQDNALRVFGTGKEKAIAKLPLGVMVDTFGAFNFKMCADVGNDALVKAGVRKPPRKPEEKRVPVRDVASGARKVIEDADSKSIDKSTRLALHGLLIAIIDRLNDVDMGDSYIPTSVSKNVRDFSEKKIEAAQAEMDAKIKANVQGKAA